jgi:hypothetical protein
MSEARRHPWHTSPQPRRPPRGGGRAIRSLCACARARACARACACGVVCVLVGVGVRACVALGTRPGVGRPCQVRAGACVRACVRAAVVCARMRALSGDVISGRPHLSCRLGRVRVDACVGSSVRECACVHVRACVCVLVRPCVRACGCVGGVVSACACISCSGAGLTRAAVSAARSALAGRARRAGLGNRRQPCRRRI